MHHPTDRMAHTTAFLHQSWSTGWNEKQLNGSTMKDRSDDPSHHERTLLPLSYISLRQPSKHAYLQEVGEVLGENVCFVTQGLQVVKRKPDNVERDSWILEPLTQHLFKKHVVRLPWIVDNHSTSMKERKD